jgi:hypothetical protein
MQGISKEDLDALRDRFLNDFEFWSSQCCFIRTKKGTIVPLVFNRVQRRFAKAIVRQMTTTGRVRFVILKARQQGFSTVISAFQYWWCSQHPAQKGLVMAHEAVATTTLFDMYKRIHDNVPPLMQPHTKYSSRTELVFDKLDTALRVATAGGKGVARSETLTVTHLSEVAFWPTTFAATNFNGLIQAVPNEPGTAAFVESTANGLNGVYHDLWEGAVSGENEFEPFFAAWFETPEYREEPPAEFRLTPDEEDLKALYDLDNAQLYWRRRKIGNTSRELFQQEYPATPEEAFLSTGAPVFNAEQVTKLLAAAPDPLRRMTVLNGTVEDNSRGELLVYVDHPEIVSGQPTGNRVVVDPKETYVIGGDVGMGVRNGDPSVAQVLDSKLRQVAVWRGLVQPDHFATVLNTLGYYFNTAMIAPERNNHGLLTCVRLGRDLMYPATFTDVTEGALEDKDSINIGFFTSERTKPLIIDKLRAVVRDATITINDKTTLKEMLTFVVTESGKMEADGDCHDDCVMSLAIANHIHEGKCTPVQVTDDFYVEAI